MDGWLEAGGFESANGGTVATLWEFDGVRAMLGNTIDCMKEIPAGTVQCCITSPPY